MHTAIARLPPLLLPAEFEDYMDGKYVFETDSAAVGITLRCGRMYE